MPHLHARMKRMLLTERKSPVDPDNRSPNFCAMPLPDQSAENKSQNGTYTSINPMGVNSLATQQNAFAPVANSMFTNNLMPFPFQSLAVQTHPNYVNSLQAFPQLSQLGFLMQHQLQNSQLQQAYIIAASTLQTVQQQLNQSNQAGIPQITPQSINQQPLHQAADGSSLPALIPQLQVPSAPANSVVQSIAMGLGNNGQLLDTLPNPFHTQVQNYGTVSTLDGDRGQDQLDAGKQQSGSAKEQPILDSGTAPELKGEERNYQSDSEKALSKNGKIFRIWWVGRHQLYRRLILDWAPALVTDAQK